MAFIDSQEDLSHATRTDATPTGYVASKMAICSLLLGAMKMSYEKVLGEVLRDVRLRAGIPHEDLAGIINASHLREIEKGLSVLKLDTLGALCEMLGITPSQLFLVVEARLAGQTVEVRLATNAKMFRKHLAAGLFEPMPRAEAARGVRGQRANFVRDEAIRLQALGLSNAKIAKKLGVTIRTVQRYCAKPAESDEASSEQGDNQLQAAPAN